MKDLTEVYHCPPTWELVDSIVIDNVDYNHGLGTGGESAWQSSCLKSGRSNVTGHNHSISGYRFHTMSDGRTLFSMKVGGGCDDKSIAMAYGKFLIQRRQCLVVGSLLMVINPKLI
jgi:hypothetical protein